MAKKPPKPEANPFAGFVKCLRCNRRFQSWDRRQNRLCPGCKEALHERPSPEPVHRIATRYRPREDA